MFIDVNGHPVPVATILGTFCGLARRSGTSLLSAAEEGHALSEERLRVRVNEV